MIRAKVEGRPLSDSESSESDENEDEDDEEEWRSYEAVVVGSSDSNDSDEDGCEATLRSQAKKQAQKMAADLFKVCDADGSGELSVHEVAEHLTEVLLRDRTHRHAKHGSTPETPAGGISMESSVETAPARVGIAVAASDGAVDERLGTFAYYHATTTSPGYKPSQPT